MASETGSIVLPVSMKFRVSIANRSRDDFRLKCDVSLLLCYQSQIVVQWCFESLFANFLSWVSTHSSCALPVSILKRCGTE